MSVSFKTWNRLIAILPAKGPVVGPILARVLAGLKMYRNQPGVVLVAVVLGMVSHALFAVGVWTTASGLYANPPTLSEHAVMVPLANVTAALPLTPAGLGTYELALDTLYRWIPQTPPPAGSGLIVALAYQLVRHS